MIDPVVPIRGKDFSLKLLNQLPIKAALLTQDLEIVWINDELEGVIGRDVRGETTNEIYSDNLDRCEECLLTEPEVPSGETREAVCEGALGGRQLKILHRGVEIDGDQFVLEIWRDITEERKAKQGLKLLSRCNQLLVRSTDEENLLKDVCKTIGEIGDYGLVWVGFPGYDDEHSVEFVASAGEDKDLLDDLEVTWGQVDGGGPTGRAIKSGEVVTAAIKDDEEIGPGWKEKLLARGYSTVASFPLKGKDGIYGALTVSTKGVGGFTGQEGELMANLADDLAFGIGALREQETRKSLEAELKELSGHLLHAREDERERISRELHDELGQLATSVIIALSGLKDRDSVQNDPKAEEKIDVMSEAVETLNGKLRNMAKEILPPTLESEDLVSTVEDYLEEIRDSEGVDVSLEIGDVESMLDAEARVQLYRVIQEAVTNAVRHGHPDEISVRLKKREDRIVLVVQDDGRGFKASEVLEEAGEKDRVGLVSMRERVRILSGSLNVESRPGKGTKLVARIPFGEENG